MSEQQQAQQLVVFGLLPPPMEKSIPTEKQIESWKDAKIYGVWIDGKLISNAELNNYTNTDFAHLFVSGLEKNAINYGKHFYQVNLMMTDHYAAYYKKQIENKDKYIMGFSHK